jgi:phage terminase Nu1 subunit (DNA packaging protein)
MALVNTKQLANAMNVTVRRVEQLVHEGLPREERGRFELGKCLLWYIRYLQKALERRAVPMSPDGEMAGLGDARVRSVTADAELKELELAERRRQMVALPDVERSWMTIVTTTRSHLLSIAVRIAPRIIGATDRGQIERLLNEEIRQALTEISQTRTGLPEFENPPGASAAPRE